MDMLNKIKKLVKETFGYKYKGTIKGRLDFKKETDEKTKSELHWQRIITKYILYIDIEKKEITHLKRWDNWGWTLDIKTKEKILYSDIFNKEAQPITIDFILKLNDILKEG